MASTISKTTYTFVVLHRTDEPIMGDDDFDGPFGGDLGAALQRSWDGNAVGAVTSEVTEEIADTEVPEELVELGNDGEFFDSDLGVGTEDTWIDLSNEPEHEHSWDDQGRCGNCGAQR
jgi:hypothetical protein